jgi:hypothetical protein
MNEKVWLFAVGGLLTIASKKKAREIADAVSRTVGFIGYSDEERGTLLVYNSLDNAVNAWHKVSDIATTGSNIMEGWFSENRHQLSVGAVAQRMRL